MTNLFAKAKVVEAKKPATKAEKKPAIEMEGLEDYIFFDQAKKQLEGAQVEPREFLNEQAIGMFIEEGQKLGRRPDNFDAKEGAASANIQLRRKSSALTEEQIELLNEHELPFDVVEKTPKRYVFNPEVLADEKKMEEISKALSKLKGCEDFIHLEEATTQVVPSDDTLNQLFKKDEDVIREILPIVACTAIGSCKLKEVKTDSLFVRVAELVGIKLQIAKDGVRAAFAESVGKNKVPAFLKKAVTKKDAA